MSCFIWQYFFTFTIHFHWIFIILHGCWVTGSSIVISREDETWLEASRICRNTYGGKLLHSTVGSRQKIDCLNTYSSNAELWSRKGLTLSPFLSHEGCYEILNNTMIQGIKISPTQRVGECYIYCRNRTDYYGIKNDTCYCISIEDKRMLQKSNRSRCEYRCTDSTDDELVFCGGRRALNIYREIQINGNKDDGKCAVINCTHPHYHLSVHRCDSKFDYVCGGENYQNVIKDKVNFTEATSLCITYDKYLSGSILPLCDTDKSFAGSMYWLDVRRYWTPTSQIQIKTKGNEFKCGYFIFGISTNMGYEKNCIRSNKRRRFACESDNTTTKGIFSCSLVSNGKPATDSTTQFQSQSTNFEFSTFTTGISTRCKGKTEGTSKEKTEGTYTSDRWNTTRGYVNLISMNAVQSGDSSVIIGAVVGVLVITGLVVASIIFIIFRRRKSKQNESNKLEVITESRMSKNDIKVEEKQNASQSHDLDQENRHYFQLEANPKHNIDVGSPPQVHLRGYDEYNEADDTVYHETGNDVYDHLNKKRNKTTDDEDMYHIANGFQSDNDEYQHIHSLKGVTNRESSSDYAKFNEDQYSAIQRDK